MNNIIKRTQAIVDHKHKQAALYIEEGFPLLAKMCLEECELYKGLLDIIQFEL